MGQWEKVEVDGTELSPPARGGHAWVLLDSQLLIFGGADRSPRAYDDLWLLELENSKCKWTRITPSFTHRGKQPLPRSGATLTAVGDCVYLYGGQDPVSGACYDDMMMLDSTKWTWTPVEYASGRPPGRHSHTANLLGDNCLIVFGGSGMNGTLGDLWVFNTATSEWTRPVTQGPQPEAREMHSATLVSRSQLLLFGGRSGARQVLSDIALLDLNALEWQYVQPIGFSRCAHSAVTFSGTNGPEVLGGGADGAATSNGNGGGGSGAAVLVYGGFSGQAVEDSVLRIDLGTKSAAVQKPEERDGNDCLPPTARFAHVAAPMQLDGVQKMVVFGGVSPIEDLGDVILWSSS